MTMTEGLREDLLPNGVRSRIVNNINGLNIHVLEAGYEEPGRECLVLLHGFPELAYSWRKIMVPLAQEGYHVVAPDQRGYGLTTLSRSRRTSGMGGSFAVAVGRICADSVDLVGLESARM